MKDDNASLAERFDWLKVGAEAYIYRHGGWGPGSLTKVTITKITKTRAFTSEKNYEGSFRSFYARKYSNNLIEHGSSDHYRAAPTLLAADDPIVAETREAIKKNNVRVRALNAVDGFGKTKSVDAARDAIAALEKYIEEFAETE
jgi:hypothetical protein